MAGNSLILKNSFPENSKISDEYISDDELKDKTECIRLLSEGRNKSIGLKLKVNCDESLVMTIIAFVLFQFWK